jgi:hypothetical protein
LRQVEADWNGYVNGILARHLGWRWRERRGTLQQCKRLLVEGTYPRGADEMTFEQAPWRSMLKKTCTTP